MPIPIVTKIHAKYLVYPLIIYAYTWCNGFLCSFKLGVLLKKAIKREYWNETRRPH